MGPRIPSHANAPSIQAVRRPHRAAVGARAAGCQRPSGRRSSAAAAAVGSAQTSRRTPGSRCKRAIRVLAGATNSFEKMTVGYNGDRDRMQSSAGSTNRIRGRARRASRRKAPTGEEREHVDQQRSGLENVRSKGGHPADQDLAEAAERNARPHGVQAKSLIASKRRDDLERGLVAGCKRGDHDSWRTLYRRYRWKIYCWAARFNVPKSDRLDVCQDVFLSVHRSLPSFRGQCRLSTWMFAIAARCAAHVWRRRRAEDDLLGCLLEPPPEPVPDPSLRSERLRVLSRLVGNLAPKKRWLLISFELKELPMREIARIVGCSEATGWARLHHARTEMLEAARRNNLPGDSWWRQRSVRNPAI